MKALFGWPAGRWYRIPLLFVVAVIVAASLLFVWGIPAVHYSSGGTSRTGFQQLDTALAKWVLPGGGQG